MEGRSWTLPYRVPRRTAGAECLVEGAVSGCDDETFVEHDERTGDGLDNVAVYLAFTKPGDTVLAMSLPHGGHLTHGSKVNFSGKWFNVVSYGVRQDNELIDYDQLRDLALEHKL